MTWDFEYEDYVDGKRHPFAIFTFRYRSKKALQAEYIVPKSPTPVPLEDRPIEELTPDELRELVRRQRVWYLLPAFGASADTYCRNVKLLTNLSS